MCSTWNKNIQITYKRFQRALTQRNAALRLSALEAQFWNSEFINHGEKLNNYRELYIHKLEQNLNAELRYIHMDKKIELNWIRGWKAGYSLEEVLNYKLVKDTQIGYTQAGPQRADLQVLMEGEKINKRASRGEQKMIVAALQIAQAKITKQFSEHSPILLIDDLPSELDKLNSVKLIDRLKSLETQIFITAIDESMFLQLPEASLFHVEHGQVTQLI